MTENSSDSMVAVIYKKERETAITCGLFFHAHINGNLLRKK